MPLVRVKNYEVGDLVPVRDCHGGYPLPPVLPQGAAVRVLEFVHAYRIVEWEGWQFKVYMANLQPGLEEY